MGFKGVRFSTTDYHRFFLKKEIVKEIVHRLHRLTQIIFNERNYEEIKKILSTDYTDLH